MSKDLTKVEISKIFPLCMLRQCLCIPSDCLSLLPPLVCCIFMFGFCQELPAHVHPCRLLASMHVCFFSRRSKKEEEDDALCEYSLWEECPQGRGGLLWKTGDHIHGEKSGLYGSWLLDMPLRKADVQLFQAGKMMTKYWSIPLACEVSSCLPRKIFPLYS